MKLLATGLFETGYGEVPAELVIEDGELFLWYQLTKDADEQYTQDPQEIMQFLMNQLEQSPRGIKREVRMSEIEQIAKSLVNDLSINGLKRYLVEQDRMICNAIKYSRSIRQYSKFKAAAMLAIKIKKGK